MALRLSTGFTNEIGDVYVLDIYDDGYGGSSTDVQVDGTGFEMSFEGDYTNYTGGNIIATACTINLIADITAVTDFISVLPTRTEAQLRVSISRNSSFWWAGLILPEAIKREDLPAGSRPIFQIKAVDGITRLQEIDYNDDGDPYEGKATIIEHVLNILNKVGTQSLWTTNTFLTTYLGWLADGHAAGENPSVFERTRIRHLNYLRVDQTGTVSFRNCYEVLKSICAATNCNFFFSDGRFWLVSLTAYTPLTLFSSRHNWTKAGSPTYVIGGANYALLGRVSQVGNYSTYNLYRETGGDFQYFPALNKAKARYKHFSARNLTPGLQGPGDAFNQGEVESIDSVGGTARIFFRASLNYRVDFVSPSDIQVTHGKFHIKIKVGDYYLHRAVTFVNTLYIIEEAPFWTLDDERYEIIVPIFEDATNYRRVIEFVTPPLPEDGDMEVFFILIEITDNLGNSFTTLTVQPTTSLTGIYMEALLDGTIEGQYNITEFQAVNNTTGNVNEAVIETLIGDGPTGNAFSALEIYDGSDWLVADGWRLGGSGDYYPFSELLVREIMYRHKNTNIRFSAPFIGKTDLYKSISYTAGSLTLTLIIVSGTFNANRSLWNLNTVAISRSASGVTVPTQENQTSVGSDGDAPPEITPGGGVVPSLNGLTQTSQDNIGEAAESGLSAAIVQGLVPMRTNLLIQSSDSVTDIEIDGAPATSSFSAGDLITVIDTATGLSQEFEVNDVAFEGDTQISVGTESATYRLNINSYIFHSPRWLLGLLGWTRRHFEKFQLFDYNEDIVQTDPLKAFWRVGTDAGMGFAGRHIQLIAIAIGQTGTATATYQLLIRKNGSSFHTYNFDSLDTSEELFFDVDASDPLANGDVFSFAITRTDGTGATTAKGLQLIFMIV